MGNVWHPCHTHESNIDKKIYFQFQLYEQFLVSKIIYETSLIIEIKFKYIDLIDLYE